MPSHSGFAPAADGGSVGDAVTVEGSEDLGGDDGERKDDGDLLEPDDEDDGDNGGDGGGIAGNSCIDTGASARRLPVPETSGAMKAALFAR